VEEVGLSRLSNYVVLLFDVYK